MMLSIWRQYRVIFSTFSSCSFWENYGTWLFSIPGYFVSTAWFYWNDDEFQPISHENTLQKTMNLNTTGWYKKTFLIKKTCKHEQHGKIRAPIHTEEWQFGRCKAKVCSNCICSEQWLVRWMTIKCSYGSSHHRTSYEHIPLFLCSWLISRIVRRRWQFSVIAFVHAP